MKRIIYYELDLLWVWTGRGTSIITYIINQVRNQENHLLLPLTVRPITWRGTKNTCKFSLVFTTQQTTLVRSFVEHYAAIWAAASWGVAAWGLAVAAQQSWAALWLGSGWPPLQAVKGDDNGSSIIIAPPFTFDARTRQLQRLQILNHSVMASYSTIHLRQNELIYRVGEVRLCLY